MKETIGILNGIIFLVSCFMLASELLKLNIDYNIICIWIGIIVLFALNTYFLILKKTSKESISFVSLYLNRKILEQKIQISILEKKLNNGL